MSATLGDSSFFSKQLTALTGAPTTLVQSEQCTVPLEFEYSTTRLQEKVAELNEQGRSPVYLVHFTHNACADTARDQLLHQLLHQGGKTRHRPGLSIS